MTVISFLGASFALLTVSLNGGVQHAHMSAMNARETPAHLGAGLPAHDVPLSKEQDFELDASGRLVGAAVPGLEPEDAPDVSEPPVS